MKYKKNIFAFSLIILMLTVSFAQNNNNQAMLNNILGGRDISSLSASELAAIRSIVQGQTGVNAQEQSAGILQLDTFSVDSLDSLDSLALDSSLIQDTLSFLQRDSVRNNYKIRYENLFFTSVFPEAFFERQGVASADYPIKPEDELVLSLWGAIEKQSLLKVDNQGKIFVDGIGLISVAGSTLAQAENTLKTKLKSVYSGISQGRVFVGLRPQGIAPSKIFVLGNVKKPGGYSLPGDANVFLALYRAGGPDDIGSVRNVVIRRATGDSAVVDLYDLIFKGIRKGEGLLRDGDIVFVPKAEKLVSIKGDVPRQAIFELRNSEKVKDILVFAGGLNPTANHILSVDRVTEDGSSEIFDLGKVKDFAENKIDTTLFFGDTLIVRKSSKIPTKYIKVIGSVWFPDNYQFSEEMEVKDAVAFAGGLKEDAYQKRVVIQRLNSDLTYSYLADDVESSKKVKLMPQDILHVFSTAELEYWDKVTLSGAVKRPMEITWQPNTNLKDLIILAGGFTKEHLPGKVYIERLDKSRKDEDKGITFIELNINDNLEIENRKDLIIEPGDRIIVPFDHDYYEQELITVTGAVESPGTYSLIKTSETINDFFKRLVRLEQKAYIRGTKFFRKNEQNITYQIAIDMENVLKGKVKNKDINKLQNGDSIHIPFVTPVIFMKGEVVSQGAVPYVEGWDAKDYLNAAGGLTLFGDDERVVITYADGTKSNMDNAERDPDPGSEITATYREPDPPIQWTQVVSAFGTIITGVSAFIIALVTLL